MNLSAAVARGTVALANAAKKLQALQVRLMADEVKDGIEHAEPYGFTARPHPDAEAIVLFVDGDRSHGLVIATPDRRYRITGLAAGEVCIYDDLGHKITLKRAGIEIDGGGHNLTIKDTPQVKIESGSLIVTGGDVVADGKSLKTHVHGGVQTGAGNTGAPA